MPYPQSRAVFLIISYIPADGQSDSDGDFRLAVSFFHARITSHSVRIRDDGVVGSLQQAWSRTDDPLFLFSSSTPCQTVNSARTMGVFDAGYGI